MKIGMELILSALLLFRSSTPVHAASDAVLDGAKKEGQVVFYASMEANRRNGSRLHLKRNIHSSRLTRPASGRKGWRRVWWPKLSRARFSADVVNQSGFDFYGVLQKGIFEIYNSPERAALPAEYKRRKGLLGHECRDPQRHRLQYPPGRPRPTFPKAFGTSPIRNGKASC